MGICNTNGVFPSKKELKAITCPNNDFSFIYTILQALDNLKNFKKFISQSKTESSIKMGKSLEKIFSDDVYTNLNKYAKVIYYIIRKYNNYIVELYPAKILIKILELLNKEQKSKVNVKEKTKMVNNFQNLMNLNSNNLEISAFYKYLKDFANDNNYNKINELFCIFFQKRIIYNYQIINYSYEHNFVFELNVFDIYLKKKNINPNQTPQLNLMECIIEELCQKFTFYNNYQCIEYKYIYSTSPYLIFILNRRKSEIYYYFHNFIYSDEIDLSSIILEKNNSNIYVLSSIIKEKRKLDENNNFIYITINRDENGEFYFYENNKKKIGKFESIEYYDHILIFKQKN